MRSQRLTGSNFVLPLLDAIDDEARPTHHIFYPTRVVDIEDGLPTFDGLEWIAP